ncbi:MAG: hypothetical protein AABX61_02635 [Nanoarchaeota archaeon]
MALEKNLMERLEDENLFFTNSLRPVSLGIGLLFGIQRANLEFTSKAVLGPIPNFFLPGVLASGIILKDNLVGGRSYELSKYNAKASFFNYTLGYGIGYILSNIL